MTENQPVACASPDRPMRRISAVRAGLLSGMIAGVVMLQTDLAAADFRICNNTGSRVGVALGYKDAEHWTTEGWWNLSARTCETILRGTLAARYYYVYAVDYDRSGEWAGRAYMCTREKEFTIRGTEDCLARGYDRTGFFEVDTGEQPSWTVQLTDSADQAPPQPLQLRVPLTPLPSSTGRPNTAPPFPARKN
jgi:uncharacterized membrane protein